VANFQVPLYSTLSTESLNAQVQPFSSLEFTTNPQIYYNKALSNCVVRRLPDSPVDNYLNTQSGKCLYTDVNKLYYGEGTPDDTLIKEYSLTTKQVERKQFTTTILNPVYTHGSDGYLVTDGDNTSTSITIEWTTDANNYDKKTWSLDSNQVCVFPVYNHPQGAFISITETSINLITRSELVSKRMTTYSTIQYTYGGLTASFDMSELLQAHAEIDVPNTERYSAYYIEEVGQIYIARRTPKTPLWYLTPKEDTQSSRALRSDDTITIFPPTTTKTGFISDDGAVSDFLIRPTLVEGDVPLLIDQFTEGSNILTLKDGSPVEYTETNQFNFEFNIGERKWELTSGAYPYVILVDLTLEITNAMPIGGYVTVLGDFVTDYDQSLMNFTTAQPNTTTPHYYPTPPRLYTGTTSTETLIEGYVFIYNHISNKYMNYESYNIINAESGGVAGTLEYIPNTTIIEPYGRPESVIYTSTVYCTDLETGEDVFVGDDDSGNSVDHPAQFTVGLTQHAITHQVVEVNGVITSEEHIQFHMLSDSLLGVCYDNKLLTEDYPTDRYISLHHDNLFYLDTDSYGKRELIIVELSPIDNPPLKRVANGLYLLDITDPLSLINEREGTINLEPVSLVPGCLYIIPPSSSHPLAKYSTPQAQTIFYALSVNKPVIDNYRYGFFMGIQTLSAYNSVIKSNGYYTNMNSDYPYRQAFTLPNQFGLNIIGGSDYDMLYYMIAGGIATSGVPEYIFSGYGIFNPQYKDQLADQSTQIGLPVGIEYVNYGSTQSLAVSGDTTILLDKDYTQPYLYYIDSANTVNNARVSWTLYGQTYIYDNHIISAVYLDSTGVISSIENLCYAENLIYLGSNNIKAYFLRDYDSSIYSFNGGRDLVLEKAWSSKPLPTKVVYDSYSNNLVWLAKNNDNNSLLYIYRNGIICEIPVNHPIDTIDVYDNGLIFTQGRQRFTFPLFNPVLDLESQYIESTDTIYPFELTTRLSGVSPSVLLDFKRIDIRFYSKGKLPLQITVDSIVAEGNTQYSTTMIYTIKPNNYDTLGYFHIKYIPQHKTGIGVSLSIKCDSFITLTGMTIDYTEIGRHESEEIRSEILKTSTFDFEPVFLH